MWYSVCLCFLWSLVKVHSQTAPYVSFMGAALPNHAYVDLSLVGYSGNGGEILQCHTDLSSCCSSSNGFHRGDWYFPAGNMLPLSGNSIYETRGDMHVDLHRRNSATSPSGIYRCDIPTNSVHDFGDPSVRDTVYVGLYYNGGNIVIPQAMTLTEVSDLNGTNPEFNLTCISTGGPATTVTWTRDNIIVNEGTETVLNDPVTAQYTHTLTGTLGGFYTCTVANDKPSSYSRQYDVQGLPSPTSLLFSWTLGEGLTAAFYTISYINNDCHNDTYDDIIGIGGNTTMYRVLDLQEGTNYSITLTAYLTDGRVAYGVLTTATMSVVPSASPTNVALSEVTTSSITVKWGPVPCIERNGIITGYLVNYGYGIENVTEGNSTETLLSNLTPSTSYNVRVAAVNDAGIGVFSNDMIIVTLVEVPVLTVGTTSSTSVFLSWTSAGSEVGSYEVMWQRDTTISCSDVDEGSTTITDGSTSYHVWGLEEDSSYIMSVTASNSAGSSEISNTVTTMTLEAVPSAAPTSVSLARVTSTTITLQWDVVDCIHRNGEISGYSVHLQWGSDIVRVVPLGDVREATITGLYPSTEYSVSVAAENHADTGVYSDDIVLTTEGPFSSVTIVSMSTSSLTISVIIADSVTATSYTISYANTNCPHFGDITGITETLYTLTGLQEGTNYSITITVILSDGWTAMETITATTLAVAPSSAPISVSLSEVTSSIITVQWGAVDCIHRNGETTGYLVQYWEIGNRSIHAITVSSGSVFVTTLSNLTPSTSYFIKVAAVNSAGVGVFSDPVMGKTFPIVHLSLNGRIILNHGYVSMSYIGSSGDNTALLCITNLPGNANGHSEGDWVAPDGTIVGDTNGNSTVPGFMVNRDPMVVRLFRNTASETSPPEGIYHCLVQDAELIHRKLFVGLYNDEGGDVTISGGMVFTLDSDVSLQFTLTCISTGGPATTVIWTRDSITIAEGTETVLDDPVTAQYTHTLTVAGSLGGLYICTVTNDKPSSDSVQHTVWVPEVFVADPGQRQVVFTWSTPPENIINLEYSIVCIPPIPSQPIILSQPGPQTVEGFSPNTTYSCSMTTKDGLPAYIDFITQQDYLFFQVRFGQVENCTELKSHREIVLKSVTSAIFEQLKDSCPTCGITNDIIDMPLFVCFPESPTFVTFRARLEGTSQTDSGSIISILEDWVKSGPSFTVTGVLMTVDSQCSVPISSLTEEECSKDTSPSSTTSQASSMMISVIGGAVAVVVFIIVLIIIIIIVVKVRRNRVKVTINKTAEDLYVDVSPRYSRRDVVSTTNNMVYEMESMEGAVGDEPDTHIYETIGCGMTAKPNPVTTRAQPEAKYVNVVCHPRPRLALSQPKAQPTAKNVGVAQEGVKMPAYYNLEIMTNN